MEYEIYRYKSSKTRVFLDLIIKFSIVDILNIKKKYNELSWSEITRISDSMAKLEKFKKDYISVSIHSDNNKQNERNKPDAQSFQLDNIFSIFDDQIFSKNKEKPRYFYFEKDRVNLDDKDLNWSCMVKRIYDKIIERYRDNFISKIVDNVSFVSRMDNFGRLQKYVYSKDKLTIYICTNYDPKQHMRNLRKIVGILDLKKDSIMIGF